MAVAAALIVVLPVVLPRGQRMLARGPFLILCLSVLFLGFHTYILEDHLAHRPFFSVAYFSEFAALAAVCF